MRLFHTLLYTYSRTLNFDAFSEFQSQRDEDLCAFGTNNKQAFDPQDSLGFDENGTCTIGLSDPVRLTQFHEGREKCDFKNPRELSVKIRGDFDNDQILIDFSDNFGRTYYTEEEDDESRVGIRMQEWRRSRDLAIVGTNGSRHLISHEEKCSIEDDMGSLFGRRLQCVDCTASCGFQPILPEEDPAKKR